MQHHALAVEGEHHHRLVSDRLARRRSARRVEGVEVLSRASDQLFRLTLGHLGPAMARQLEQRFVERPRCGRFGHPAAHLERVTLSRQVQRRIERMQTVVTVPRVAQALDRHRPEGRLQLPVVQPPLRTLDAVGPLDRTRRLPRAALVEVQGLARRKVGFGASCKTGDRPDFLPEAAGRARSANGTLRSRRRGATDAAVQGTSRPVMRASTREEMSRISVTIRSSSRLFSIHSR